MSAASLAYRVVNRLDDLLAVREAWSALLADTATNEPTLSLEWLVPWWHVFGGRDGRRMQVVLVYAGTRLIGAAPLLGRLAWVRRAIPFRRLELFGSGEDEADETCSDYIGVLAARGYERDVAGQVVHALTTGAIGGWDDLVLRAADGDAAMTGIVIDALRARGLRVERLHDPRRDAPYIALPDSWDAYLKGLSSSRRAWVRRSMRKLAKWAGDELVVHVATTPGELAEGRKVLHDLHGERWGDRGQVGAFASPLFRSFHDQVMPALLERGNLELLWMTVGDRPLAAVYNIVWDNKVHFYQSGRCMEVPKDVRPGIAIHAEAIQRAISAGRREYDFLASYGPYAERLATGRRPIVTVRATRVLSAQEAARRGLERVVDHARSLRDRVREARSHDKGSP